MDAKKWQPSLVFRADREGNLTMKEGASRSTLVDLGLGVAAVRALQRPVRSNLEETTIMVIQKYVDLAAPEPWLLQMKLQVLQSALRNRNGRIIFTQAAVGGQEAKLRIHYEVPLSGG